MRLALAAALFLTACQQPRFRPVEQKPETPPVKDAPKVAAIPEEAAPQQPQIAKAHYSEMDWRILRGLNSRTGELSPALRKLEGGAVRLTGYMVPFADEFESANEFLLVPEAGMCVHTPPPPANQIVFVQMTGGAAKVTFAKPVAVAGIISIVQSDSPYGKVAFKIEASEAKEDSTGSY